MTSLIPDYAPVDAGDDVQLSDNTNRWGASPAALRVIADAAAEINDYPSADGAMLRDAAADYLGMVPSHVVTGCGSDGVINAVLGTVGKAGDRLAFCEPTFGLIPALAAVHGLQPVKIPFRTDMTLDVDGLLRAEARVIYVCAPNNPTGSPVDPDLVVHLAQHARGVVLVDEAYAEYAGTTVVGLVERFPNLVVTRTLSKAFGLAGLRAGYGVASPVLARAIQAVRGPFTLNRLAERAGASALRDDRDWMLRHVRTAVGTRDRLAASLRAAGYAPLLSAANFLCVPVPDAAVYDARLRRNGIAVRAFPALQGVGDALRVTSAPWPQLEGFLTALADVGGIA